jgi:putative glutamine amidotransferase
MTKPRILLSGGNQTTSSGVAWRRVPETYGRCVARAGGLPTMALHGDGADYAAAFDGLLLTGGIDADPALFGEAPLNETVEVDPLRDRQERALFDAFFAAGKPVFGICRGIQMLAVFLGGTLWQDLPAQKGLTHSVPEGYMTHGLTVKPGHPLAVSLGGACTVNSFHHQAVRELPQGLVPFAWSPDGLVEAVEHVSRPVWGVQWHPERMTGEDPALPDHGALFDRFVEQCRG